MNFLSLFYNRHVSYHFIWKSMKDEIEKKVFFFFNEIQIEDSKS